MKPNQDVQTDELARVNAQVAERLSRRGLEVTGNEDPEQMAELLEAVERFEGMVEARGGDLMVDDLNSQEPDDPHFVMPARARGESLRHYIQRLDAATDQIRRHPPIV
ncbi:MAG TPA: hypothetical protein VFU23_00775 [Gemmatimonadales bacterium]|nr:hypothetical protein [Gemmatimonadales bacterium]